MFYAKEEDDLIDQKTDDMTDFRPRIFSIIFNNCQVLGRNWLALRFSSREG